MRFHVIGIGPIGSLVAFHLRRALPPALPITLVVKTKGRARDLRTSGGIAIETGGMPITQGGFDVEIFDPLEEVVFDLVYNKDGEMRLPSAARAWRREGELGPAESMDSVQKPIESLIVCTKAHSTVGVFRRIRRRLTSHSTVVLLQNGMGVYDHLVSELFRNPFDRPQFVLATTTHAARSKTHGSMFHTIHTGQGDLAFGIVPDPNRERDFERSKWNPQVPPHARALSLDDIAPFTQNGAPRDRCSSLRDTIAALSNLTSLSPIWEPMSDVQVRLKRKLVVNACINPMTAITESSNGALFGNETARYVTKTICDEAAAVFAREAAAGAQSRDFISRDIEESDEESYGKNSPSQVPEAPRGLRSFELQDEVFRVARRTSLNYSSMLVDLWKGRNTEIEHLNGYLRRLGQHYAVPTPSNDLLYNLIKLKERVVPAARI
ncbi:ketopantoate reductase PanE/ApbA C terminal-domain-containing protein [Gautieria morchelliformis]|nr:ketopantoate reductase PanE/ApbA C terminal-domain-containing protein [Gautieria morchelliformis]